MAVETMNKIPRCLALYLLFALAVLAFAGCASLSKDATARDKYADAERAFQVAVDASSAAFRTGKLKGPTLELVKAALIEADAALAQMNARVKSGNTIEADYWLGRVEAAVRTAQGYLVNIEPERN